MFVLGEKVVYAGHGVAKISRVVEKKVAGATANFFELKFVNKDMTILVPTNNLDAVGVRRLSSREKINDIFAILSQPLQSVSHDLVISNNWNKRNKDYQCRLRSGNLSEICMIYRDLKCMAAQKELSFGEKGLLVQTEALLVEEIAIVENMQEDMAMEQLRSLVNARHYKQPEIMTTL
ncbi:MAG: hypothetical protein NTX86_00045 [Candidatus Dependentiae bacterium]|nr:hypothetical protein [Candidatus Dependentiae bacterium]